MIEIIENKNFCLLNKHTRYWVNANKIPDATGDHKGKRVVKMSIEPDDKCQIFQFEKDKNHDGYFRIKNVDSGYYMYVDDNGKGYLEMREKTNVQYELFKKVNNKNNTYTFVNNINYGNNINYYMHVEKDGKGVIRMINNIFDTCQEFFIVYIE